MALDLTLPDNGYLRLSFTGAAEVAGVNQQQSFDLTVLPEEVRKSLGFSRSFLIFAKPTSTGMDNVSFGGIANGADGIPASLTLNFTCDEVTDTVELDIWILHSEIGAVSTISRCYFIGVPSLAPIPSYVLSFGGNLDAPLKYAKVNGDADSVTSLTYDVLAQQVVPYAGKLTALTYNQAGGPSTVELFVDGVSQGTYAASGTHGVIVLPDIAVGVNALVAVQFASDTAPGNSTWAVGVVID